MAEADMPRTMRIVAVGAAVVALLFTFVAGIVVLTRTGEPETAPATSVRDHVVKAADVVRLRNQIENVVDAGTAKGVRIKDAALAQALGIEAGDVITSLSGKPTLLERDVNDMMLRLGTSSVTTLYVDVTRGGKQVLLRWKLDGDLLQARSAAISSTLVGLGSASTATPATAAPGGDLALLLATIEKVDDAHYKIARSTVDAMLADPMAFMKSVRVVPSIKDGKPEGMKMYAIRPSSVFARLGFWNGDTVTAVNGFDLDTPDEALEVYTKLRDATELTFDITRRGRPVALTIQITK